MKIFKLISENSKLRKRANSFEVKYNAANEELLTLYRNKSSLIDERDQYKAAAAEYKEKWKEQKRINGEMDSEKSKLKEELKTKNLKIEKLINQLKKYQTKPTAAINKKTKKKGK